MRTAVLVVAVAGLLSAGLAPAGQVTVRVVGLREVRAMVFSADRAAYAPALARHLGLTLYLQLISKKLARPNYYGHIVVRTDVDSSGHVLGNNLFLLHALKPVRSRLSQDMRKAGELGFPVMLRLGLPGAKAKLVRRVRGWLLVYAGGVRRSVRINNVVGKQGQVVHNAALKAAHVRVGFPSAPKAPGKPRKWFNVEMQAPRGVLLSEKITDKKGRTVNRGVIVTGVSGKQQQFALPLRRPLLPGDALHLRVLVGMKIYRVPFDLKNIPLPK